MIQLSIIQNIIKEFAEKYNFIQEKYIQTIESSDFNRQNYLKINNKPFISLQIYKYTIEIVFGKINIEVDTIDEEESYSIEKNNYFIIDTLNFENEDLLIDTITKECKNYKLI